WLTKDLSEKFNVGFPSWLNIGIDNKLFLSGRTAIDFVIKDIQNKTEVNSVYFPSYCCQSMLQPFLDVGIKVVFYDVDFHKGLKLNINENQQCDIFFAMNYFGFSSGRMDRYIEMFKQRNITVIEDFTHSLLSKVSYNDQSDYIVA